MQDQERKVQSEPAEDCEEVQEEVQEGPQEEKAYVPEALLRARLGPLLMTFDQVRAGEPGSQTFRSLQRSSCCRGLADGVAPSARAIPARLRV